MAGTEEPTHGWSQFGLTDDTVLPFHGRDIERAKALLAEAGASNISATIL